MTRRPAPQAATPPRETRVEGGESIRLNRFLAMLGVGSRRDCDDVISAGRVKVDGEKVREPGVRVIPGVTRVDLDGAPLANLPRPVVLLLNKPAGFVSTVSDPLGRPTVLDLCKPFSSKQRLFPVGRLDVNTTGAILLTNDGALCYRLTHPRFQIARIYVVRVRGELDESRIRRLARMSGTRTGAGAPRPVELVKGLGKESILRITLREGRNRQVRRMCEAVGLRVTRLKRVQFGPITIRKLPVGGVRPLGRKEIESLRRSGFQPEN
jgi:23S rRNA pseudouridine2605 synthase